MSVQPRWPVLVADLADQDARDFLQGVALAKGSATLPLMSAPAGSRPHVLEIYTPDTIEPLRVFALPVGSPTRAGFPLQLFPFDPANPPSIVAGTPARMTSDEIEHLPPVRGRSERDHRISHPHLQELDGARAPATSESLVGRRLAAGKLRIDALVGEGGMGAVFRAFHRDLRIDVAVKVLQERLQLDFEFCRRFHAEALAASRLDHPNLMRVLDFGQEPDGLLYLAMEYVPGHSLADELMQGKAFPMGRLVDIMMQVCAGLAHAHARGIVHRDVKPENVLLVDAHNDDGQPVQRAKVCDFGIATEVSELGTLNAVVGTPEYMAPEQCRGAPLDGRVDVYACGVMLYELATGQLPFQGSAKELMKRHRDQLPLRPRLVNPSVPEALETIIMRALAKDPKDRQPTIRDLRQELRAVRTPSAVGGDGTMRGAAVLESANDTPAPSSLDPDWLQRSVHIGSEGLPVSATPKTPTVAEDVGTSTWLARFAATTKRAELEAMAKELEAAMPSFVAAANVKALFAIRSTVDGLAEESSLQLAWKAQTARSIQRLFGEPKVLGMLTELALQSDAPSREVTELLIRIGTPSAYALYAGRLKQTSVTAVRRRFVNMLRRIGIPAMPMIRAALLKIESRREIAIAAALAVDLLAGSPRLRDDEAGAIVSRYLEPGAGSALRVVAIESLVGFWRERAVPILLGFVGGDEDECSAAAVRGLAELASIDAHVAARIAVAVKTGGPSTREAVEEVLDATAPTVRKVLVAALAARAHA